MSVKSIIDNVLDSGTFVLILKDTNDFLILKFDPTYGLRILQKHYCGLFENQHGVSCEQLWVPRSVITQSIFNAFLFF